MSSDDYGIIHHYADGYGLTVCFDSDEGVQDLSQPYCTSDNLNDLISIASGEGFEYGFIFTDAVLDEMSEDTDPCLAAKAEAFDKIVDLFKTSDIGYDDLLFNVGVVLVRTMG